MGAIEAILALFSGGGAIIYHLMILLALEAAAGIALVEYRHTNNPDQRHYLLALSVALLIRFPLLIRAPLQSLLTLPPLLYIVSVLLDNALEVISLTLLWWGFLSPLVGRRAGRTFLYGNLLLALATTAILTPLWYQELLAAVPLDLYGQVDLSLQIFQQQPVWDAWATLIALSAAVLLFVHRKRIGHALPAICFTVIALGNGLMLLGADSLGRLINLFGYPLLAVAVYRTALQDMWAYRQELETLSERSLRQTQELLFLVEIGQAIGESLELNAVLPRVTENIAHALDADRAAILLLEEEHLRLAAQYTPLQRSVDSRQAPSIRLQDCSVLDHAIRQQRQVTLNTQGPTGALDAISGLLGAEASSPMLIQPLTQQNQPLGLLIVTNEHSRRAFGDKEIRLCNSIASQVSAAISNAMLYQDLARALQVQEKEAGQKTAILESIAEGVIVADADGRARLMNAAAERILNTQRERILGRPLQQILGTPPATVRELTVSATPLQALFELENKQIHVNAAPVMSGNRRLGTVAVLRDITAEVQAERSKREFIATISHELRTPLTAILGYTEVLHNRMVGELNETQSQFIHVIHENARRMISMANNLIALSEAERGHLELEYGEADLNLIINRVVQDFIPEMESKQLQWSVEVDDLPVIEGDPARIQQAIANLVSNAVKYTFPGGHITVGAAAVREPGDDKPAFCQIWVRDTGIGIPLEEQSRIWERFYRADNPLQVEAGGLGVGLSITQSLIQAHGGRIWLDSTPNEGSTFTVLLPVSRKS